MKNKQIIFLGALVVGGIVIWRLILNQQEYTRLNRLNKAEIEDKKPKDTLTTINGQVVN